jgi:hypothetical protein
MSRHRHSRRRASKSRHKGSRRAKRSQNRRGIRASAKGFRKMKRRGRTRVTGRTFRKLRRHAKNPYSHRFKSGRRKGQFRRRSWGGGAGARRHRKNPGGVYHRTLRDGSKVTVHEDGEIVVHDARGAEYERYRVKPYEVSRVLKGLGTGKHATKGHYHYDSVQGEYQTLSRNPRGRRGRGRGRGRSRRNCGSMRNPAQFPMPFVSAMNPRRGRGRRRGRRNPPIRRKDARAMKRVLRTHHYRCR